MASERSELPFADAIDFQEGPGILARDFRPSGVPLIRLSGLDRGGRVLDGCNYLDPALVEQKWAHFRVQPGDVLLSTSASLGRTAIVDPASAGAIPYTGIIRMRPRATDKVAAEFIPYLLQSTHFQQQVEAVGVGSVIRHFGPSHLRQMKVLLPPLGEQRAIAHIISTLDDKIELNRRTNETLEAMARALFKSWFVDFDPVRAKAEGRAPSGMDAETAKVFPRDFVKSGLGPIPKGWRTSRLGDWLELKRGYDLPAARRNAGHVPIISSSGSSGLHNEAKVRAPGVVTGRYGTIGLVFYVRQDFWPLNTTLYVRDFKSTDPLYAFHLLRVFDYNKFSDKAAVPGVNRNHLHEEVVVAPPPELQRTFARLAGAWLDLAAHSEKETVVLAELRDTLFPRLLSGELPVAAAERELEATA